MLANECYLYVIVMTKERFTVMINTFKRPGRMKEAVQYYSSCPYVSEVYVVWCEEKAPPAALVANYKARKMPTVCVCQNTTRVLT